MNQMALSSWWWVAADKEADRNTSVLFEGFLGRDSLAGFHQIRYAWENPGRMGFVIPIGWNYMTRPTVKIIYAPNIRSSFCYKTTKNQRLSSLNCLIYIYIYIFGDVVVENFSEPLISTFGCRVNRALSVTSTSPPKAKYQTLSVWHWC